MPTYLIQFAQFHNEFRLPELLSLAKLEKVNIKYNEQEHIFELWGEGNTYEEVHNQVKKTSDRWPAYNTCSFKFVVSSFGSTIPYKEQINIINSFSYLGFEGPIDMKSPDVQFHVLADFGAENGTERPLPLHIYMGELIATGSRDLVNLYNLKKRKYLGTTSMDAELSLVMANQALAAPGKLVYDPFVGTGSFLFTCAHFGAFTLGSDIDGRQIRGKGNASVHSNIEQYNLQGRVLDTLVFDICHHPWRSQQWIDAIVTDPPYGVRAGAKKLGRHDGKELTMRTYDGVPMHTREDYYPPTKPYEMSEVLVDLLNFAAKHLLLGGRLVYWLPTIVDEYSNDDVPQHPCMKLISNSEQNFGQWSRRLITMEKIKDWVPESTASIDHTTLTEEEKAEIIEKGTEDPKRPGHFLFREKYFNFGRDFNEKKN
ncbi:S-adenosyl-L-methionine-dependent methyltransferase [Cokeromyces recurvatus]|uniref:S-adenosyl-L-methionine-dependent methyltransferase n=1 Tax=Cokeromyces recurvatus TaxID=90255 RepID=UPI00221ED594|nr:S-adenosyl-L-methionine-dependent methyltransferase [Cokeromyces recurvatus]KAI7902319.1 S-adenosyl-L-methionine-dependent methyltransferase [Cokeromyces recurvatus]